MLNGTVGLMLPYTRMVLQNRLELSRPDDGHRSAMVSATLAVGLGGATTQQYVGQLPLAAARPTADTFVFRCPGGGRRTTRRRGATRRCG